jgi:gluconate 2-dehydrogenase gamma chain
MQRRDLLRTLGAVATIPALAGLSTERLWALGVAAHGRQGALRTLSADQARSVGAIADLILPRTDIPGATDTGVVEFVDLLLTEWYSPTDRENLLYGLGYIDGEASARGGATFADLTPDAQAALATELDGATERPDPSAAATWRTLKGLTVYGYFTSKPVMQDVLKYKIWPGRWDACVPA